MNMKGFVDVLHGQLSKASRILTDPQDAEFQASLERWSNFDLKVPGAIIKPASEQDIVLIIKEAVKLSIPFVASSGGHSSYSTIKENGFVLDLSSYKDIALNLVTNTVTVRGGVLMKELQVALNNEGQFTTVSNGNTVGVIPYFLNGGISSYTPLIGFGCENIVSARLITADSDVVEATELHNPELLWAIRGAGQFFGLVIELVIRTYPLSVIGNPLGLRQLGTYVFLPQQVSDVCRVMRKIMMDSENISAGHFMIVAAPPHLRQAVMVAPQFFGSPEQAAKAFQPLVDLGPLQQMQTTSNFETHSDHLDMMCAKGDFKRFTQTGLEGFRPDNFMKLIDIHDKLLSTCPGSERSSFTFEWHSPCQQRRELDTSFGNRGVDFWFNVITWYTDPAQHEEVARLDQASRAQMRSGTEEKDFIAYANGSREDPIEHRYKGLERLEKLRSLKKKWDPLGVFTKELL